MSQDKLFLRVYRFVLRNVRAAPSAVRSGYFFMIPFFVVP
jgi:hypothetical protein